MRRHRWQNAVVHCFTEWMDLNATEHGTVAIFKLMNTGDAYAAIVVNVVRETWLSDQLDQLCVRPREVTGIVGYREPATFIK